jgi:hypothetical protein
MFSTIEKEIKIPQNKIYKQNSQLNIPGVKNPLFMRSGTICSILGPPGSGKSQLLYNMFSKDGILYQKFENVYVLSPELSDQSYKNNPFRKHNKLFYVNDEIDLISYLNYIYEELLMKKQAYIDFRDYMQRMKNKKQKKEKKTLINLPPKVAEEEEEEPVPYAKIEYSIIILDDCVNFFKNKETISFLKKFLIKSRHCMASFLFLSQSYMMVDKTIRKLVNSHIIFKPRSLMEWENIRVEVLGLNIEKGRQLYNFLFNEEYNHFDIDFEDKFYKNFALVKLIENKK